MEAWVHHFAVKNAYPHAGNVSGLEDKLARLEIKIDMAKAAKAAKDREAVDSSDDNTVTSAEPDAAKIRSGVEADVPPDVISRIGSGLANLFLPGDS